MPRETAAVSAQVPCTLYNHAPIYTVTSSGWGEDVVNKTSPWSVDFKQSKASVTATASGWRKAVAIKTMLRVWTLGRESRLSLPVVGRRMFGVWTLGRVRRLSLPVVGGRVL